MRSNNLLFAVVSGSHFRSGSFQFSTDVDDAQNLIMTRTLNYRRGMSGYTPACFPRDVEKANKSDTMEYEHCFLQTDNSTCGVYDTTYIVNDIEKNGYIHSQWCYGYIDENISKPAEPFEYYFQNCCWVDLTDDDGEVYADGNFKLFAKYNVLENNSPQVKVPPIWRIMTGCPDQSLHLNPSDKDGDRIRCRWSSIIEAKNGNHEVGNFESLSLDEETCIITYDGRKDSITSGVKPISIQIEDFDASGKVKSSIPIQFLATVWTPRSTGNYVSATRDHMIDELDAEESFFWGDVFSFDNHDEQNNVRHRRGAIEYNPLTNNPYYCDEPSKLEHPSPAAGEEIQVTGKVTIHLRATYYEDFKIKYNLNRFQFNSPQGMECSALDKTNGKATCTWLPTLEQQKQKLFDFCFLAIDKYGRSTERRCVTLKIVKIQNDVHSLLNHIAPNFAFRALNDYGCAGIGSLNPFVGNAGKLVDDIDSAINAWKICIRCAMELLTDNSSMDVPKYRYHSIENYCMDNIGTIKRSICECDSKFADTLLPLIKPDSKYEEYKECAFVPRNLETVPSCCADSKGLFKLHNGEKSCCDASGSIMSIGECMNDVSRPYKAHMAILRPEYEHIGAGNGKDTNGKGNGFGSGNKNPNKWVIEGTENEGKLTKIN